MTQMSCPVCGQAEAFLAAVIREAGETRLMLRCRSCPAVYPLRSETICPCLEAFAEVVNEDFRELPTEALEVHEKCISADHEFCPHYHDGTCPREVTLCKELSGGAIFLPLGQQARILLKTGRR
jgi:hypothetical protein